MSDDSRLAITVTHADGRSTRWGYDEADGGDIPGDLTFGTVMPGGYGPMSCSLLREIEPRSDEALFDDVHVYGPGGQTAYQGRIVQLPRQGGRTASVTPGAAGWSAHLQDDASFREIYIDRDPSSWEAPSRERQAGLMGTGYGPPAGPSTTSDSALPALQLTHASKWGSTAAPIAEAWYRCPPGCHVGLLHYNWQKAGGVSTADTNWTWRLGSSDDDIATNTSLSSNLRTATEAISQQFAPASPYRFGLLQFSYAAVAGGADNAAYSIFWRKLAVYGDHGVTRHAVDDPDDPAGFYASDVIADVVDRAAPLLTYTTGATGSITPTTFAIPHLAFATPTTAADVVAQVNAYHGWDWAVWDDRAFYFTEPGTGVEWQARIADGAQMSLEGDTAEQIVNGVIVAYTAGGLAKLAGPVGSGCDVESSSLQDDNVYNPVNAHGIPSRWPVVNIGFPTTDAGAVQLGAIFLGQQNLATGKGQITLQGTVRHPTEGMVPVWRIRAGDSVIVTDKAGDVSRRIVSTSYTHPSRTVTLDCGRGSDKLEALLQRINAYTSRLS